VLSLTREVVAGSSIALSAVCSKVDDGCVVRYYVDLGKIGFIGKFRENAKPLASPGKR
jgi:hypothetical protein